LIKDYDLQIHYHLGKANGVVDALSRKSYCNSLVAKKRLLELHEELEKLRLEAYDSGQLHTLKVTYTLEDQIQKAQKKCPEIGVIKASMKIGQYQDFEIDEQGTLWLKQRICVHQD
jgi:hypothetical protein